MFDPISLLTAGATVLSTWGSLQDRKQGSPQLDLGALRKEAKQNGFNPLTVLRMTGGSGFVSQAQPGRASIIGSGLASLGQQFMQQQDREAERAETDARMALMAAQTTELMRPPSPAYTQSLPGGYVSSERPMAPMSADPQLFQLQKSRWADYDAADIPQYRMRKPDGTYMLVRADMAERLGLADGGSVLAEDVEAVSGEVAAEIFGAGQLVTSVGTGTPPMQSQTGRDFFDRRLNRRIEQNGQYGEKKDSYPYRKRLPVPNTAPTGGGMNMPLLPPQRY